MYEGCKKYIPFTPIKMEHREWPDKVIDHAPIWCSVDLRDGNQALVNPMNLEEKLEMFQLLVDIGVKEIEVGFPSASETEYEILRTLIEKNCIPDDVTIQVLVQAREHLIRKTFEAIEGAKNVIVHFYNSTSTLQRKVVFKKDMDGIIEIAANGAKLIKELTDEMLQKHPDINIRYEYSPESFTGTEMDNAVAICERVMELLDATPENKVILNLPSTVEGSTPNGYADQIEYFCKHLKNRESAIISLHPHNDRGTGVAGAELSLMAGADRIEGTLFGNGERTGNVDIVTLALNMYTQGVDPQLDFHDINHVREVYERTTKMRVGERQPYAGTLVFTAFSGSHQDAINKGEQYMKTSGTQYWEVPYLPIDPADVGREYEPIIRINSQSGKGGIGYILEQNYGYDLPPKMREALGYAVKDVSDHLHKELNPKDVYGIFESEFLNKETPFAIPEAHYIQKDGIYAMVTVTENDITMEYTGKGNGRLDAVSNAIKKGSGRDFSVLTYKEHALETGSTSHAVAYVGLTWADGETTWGAGQHTDIMVASVKALASAINNHEWRRQSELF